MSSLSCEVNCQQKQLLQLLNQSTILINIIIEQIYRDGEKSDVSTLTQTTCLKLFNIWSKQFSLLMQDSSEMDITERYNGLVSQSATSYGVKLLDSSCQYNNLLIKTITAHDGVNPIPLDRLTVTGTQYIDSTQPNSIPYSEAFRHLNQHLEFTCCTIRQLHCCGRPTTNLDCTVPANCNNNP